MHLIHKIPSYIPPIWPAKTGPHFTFRFVARFAPAYKTRREIHGKQVVKQYVQPTLGKKIKDRLLTQKLISEITLLLPLHAPNP